MSDTDLGRNNPNAEQEPGFLHIEEKEDKQPEVEAHPAGAESSAAPRVVERSSVNTGTVEHLAARKAMPALDTSTPAFKQRMAELRAALTRLVTGIRWDNLSVDEAANQVIPLLNVGPVQQWKAEMIPFLFEIDRAGNFVPVWLHIIERGDPPDLPADANPAETATGRARRFAILMLGRYKHGWAVEKQKSLGFSRQGAREDKTESLPKILARLAIDPNTSLYATQALVQMGTNSALQALLEAHKQAEGWAKIDVMEALLALNLEQFHEILLASALERVPGLESYAAIPLYRSIPLEKYLHTEGSASSYTARQAALVLGQVLQNSLSSASKAGSSKPIAFERDLSLTLTALLDELHAHATWEHTLALHYSGRLMGYYWGAISKGAIKEPEIVDPVYSCLPMMHEVERWINGSGRDTLLEALSEGGEDINLTPLVKVLGELRDSRANGPLTA
ncbi:MAG: hypothetical protein J2P36_24525, partial [Ktedonobacteraceae bacterium]|nr:hypothetical protein [Ktedonobacteraceae bacterium]